MRWASRWIPCAGILLLSKEQGDWAGRVPAGEHSAVLVEPVSFKQLKNTLQELLA